MPDVPIKPPNKRVNELVTEITEEMWDTFNLSEHPDIRNEKVISFWIRKIAETRAVNEILQQKIDEIINR